MNEMATRLLKFLANLRVTIRSWCKPCSRWWPSKVDLSDE